MGSPSACRPTWNRSQFHDEVVSAFGGGHLRDKTPRAARWSSRDVHRQQVRVDVQDVRAFAGGGRLDHLVVDPAVVDRLDLDSVFVLRLVEASDDALERRRARVGALSTVRLQNLSGGRLRERAAATAEQGCDERRRSQRLRGMMGPPPERSFALCLKSAFERAGHQPFDQPPLQVRKKTATTGTSAIIVAAVKLSPVDAVIRDVRVKPDRQAVRAARAPLARTRSGSRSRRT